MSAFTLYYTSLKGPDIVLREEPRFIQKPIQREDFDRFIPDSFDFEANLTFLNNGTASGVLRIDPFFESMKELAPFFKKAIFRFGLEPNKYTWSNSMPPVPIHEKGSIVVCVALTVDFHDWKKHFIHEPVPKEKICEILCLADSENKKRFSHFCAVLKSGMHIGMVSIKSYQTTRKKTEERILVDSQHVGVLDEELIGNFRSWEKRWDTIDPDAILAELRQVRECFDKELHERIEQNFKKLMGVVEIGALETDLLDAVRRRFGGYETRVAIVDFILRSTQLDSRLREYDLRTREWNRKSDLLREGSSNKNLAEILDKEMGVLREESGGLAAEIGDLLNTLQECYMSHP